jgi:hypothetical protein
MNKKAFFSTITGSFLVIVIVAVVLGFFFFQGLTLQSGTVSEEQRDKFIAAKNFKDNLLICHQQTFLSEKTLKGTECDNLIGEVKGYKVVQEAFFDCSDKDYGLRGSLGEDTIVYKIAIEQEEDGKRCAGRLLIYI